MLGLTDMGQSWTALSEYLFEDLDFEYPFDVDKDGVEDDRSGTRPVASTSAR